MTEELGVDYNALAEGLQNLRETLAIMVAGLINDGFSEEQARVIITGVMSHKTEKED